MNRRVEIESVFSGIELLLTPPRHISIAFPHPKESRAPSRS